MNKLTFFPIFLLLFLNAKAQDKIISIDNDTIRCKILSINRGRIFYELKNNDGSITGKFISLSRVTEFSRYDETDKDSAMTNAKTRNPVNAIGNRWRLALNAGKSVMPWYIESFEFSSGMPDYFDKLKSGFHINGSAHYLIRSFFGLGVEYSFFKTGTSGSLQKEYSTTLFLMQSERYHQYINYLGPSVLFKQHLDANGKVILTESVSAGMLFFRLEGQSTYPSFNRSAYSDIINNTLITGKSISGKFGITAEYKILESISVGVGGNFLWSSLKKASFESKGSDNYSYSSDKEDLSNHMKLSRFDYSIVMRYCF